MKIQCKGCGQPILEEQARVVGEWLFCRKCFENLLHPTSEKKEEREENPDEKKIELEKIKEKAEVRKASDPLWVQKAKEKIDQEIQCQICEKKIHQEKYKTLGNWALCLTCYAKLIPRSLKEKPAEPETKGPPPPLYSPPTIEKYPGADSGKKCQGCDRQLVEEGYHTVNEEPFCPECYYTLVALDEEANRSKKSKGEPVISTGKHWRKCDACSRELPEEAFQVLDGFVICQACLTSDADSALYIARVRHGKYLRQLQEGLE